MTLTLTPASKGTATLATSAVLVKAVSSESTLCSESTICSDVGPLIVASTGSLTLVAA